MLRRDLPLSVAAGLMLAGAFVRPGAWPLAWFALVPLFFALRSAGTPKAAACGLAAGLTYFGMLLHWATEFGCMAWIALTVMQTAYMVVTVIACARVMPGRIGWWGYVAVPAAWTAMAWVRALGTFGFTWGGLAHSQANNLIVAQLASVTGPWGIDFLLCFANIALTRVVFPGTRRQRWAPAGICAIVTLTVCIGGFAVMHQHEQPPTVRIAVIQGNQPWNVEPNLAYVRATLATYSAMSDLAAKSKPDLIVWPETTLPVIVDQRRWGGKMGSLARRHNANYLIGAYDRVSETSATKGYTAGLLFDRGGAYLGAYRKMHLVPFGEFVPFRDYLPFTKWYHLRETDIVKGSAEPPLLSDIGTLGVNICFESFFPRLFRRQVQDGATILFVLTNDSWFGHTPMEKQHLMMSKLRAIENHRYVVQAAATGTSAIIDPNGRVTQHLDAFQRGIVHGKVASIDWLTIYSQYGDFVAYACLFVAISTLVLRRRPTKQRAH